MKWTPKDTAHQLQRLARYTSIVNVSKYSLIGVAALLLIMVFLVPVLHGDDSGARLVFTNMESGNFIKPRMSNPHFQGMNKDGQPYTVTAEMAERQKNGEILLTALEADMTLSNGSWLAFNGKTGIFDAEANTLFLPEEVEIYHDAGYDMRTTRVIIDLDGAKARGDQLVKGQGPLGRLEASGFAVDNEAGRIIFAPDVTVILYTQGMKDK